MLEKHGMFNDAGPMWLGNLWNGGLTSKMYQNALSNEIFRQNKQLTKFLKIIKEESKINSLGFYDLHAVCEKNKIKALPRKEFIKAKIINLGNKVSDTHFKAEGIRSDIPLSKLVGILNNK